MPVSKAALRKASRRISSEGRLCRVQDVAQNDGAFGQRARLVGAKDIHAAEVLDRVQAADDDATLAHGPGTGGKGHADDRRQQLRRQADRERHGEQQGLDHRAVEKQIHRQHEQDDDDHHADEQIAELAHAAREVGLGRPRSQPCRDRPELGPAAGLDDENLRRAAADRGAEKDGIGPRRKGASGGTIPGRFSTGKDSPVMLASLTRKSCASITRPSAGIRLPAESRMRSPGTIVLTGTVCSTPSRTTRHVNARRRFSSSTAVDARYS